MAISLVVGLSTQKALASVTPETVIALSVFLTIYQSGSLNALDSLP